MRLGFATIAALAAPILAQSTTPAPTTDDWRVNGPPWATSDPAKWSSIYNSLLSDGKIPSTLTAAPWPTGSWGPGSGPWGPGHGPGGPGGPGRHWGGTYLSPTISTNIQFSNSVLTKATYRIRRPRTLGFIKLGPLERLVHQIRLAQRSLDCLVGRQRMPAI